LKSASNIIIYGDGGSRGNPGEAAYGFAIFDEQMEPIFSEGGRIGINTNNVAEYMAVVKALEYVSRNLSQVSIIEFRLDSMLIASQMSGIYKVKHPSMKELNAKALNIQRTLNAQVTYKQIPRALNKVADALVNDALDNKI
jgi:ribonuclease HI